MDFGGNRIKSGIPTKVNMGDSGSDSTQNTVVREFISAYFKPQVKPHRERLDWLITLWMELCWAPLDISCFKISWDCNVWASLCERVGLWNSGLVTPTTHAHTLLKKILSKAFGKCMRVKWLLGRDPSCWLPLHCYIFYTSSLLILHQLLVVSDLISTLQLFHFFLQYANFRLKRIWDWISR